MPAIWPSCFSRRSRGHCAAPQATAGVSSRFDQVRNVINARCTSCHSVAPVHPAFPVAPLGIMFDTDEQIVAEAERIYQQTVVTRVMPIGNLTAMTNEERQVIDRGTRACRRTDDRLSQRHVRLWPRTARRELA